MEFLVLSPGESIRFIRVLDNPRLRKESKEKEPENENELNEVNETNDTNDTNDWNDWNDWNEAGDFSWTFRLFDFSLGTLTVNSDGDQIDQDPVEENLEDLENPAEDLEDLLEDPAEEVPAPESPKAPKAPKSAKSAKTPKGSVGKLFLGRTCCKTDHTRSNKHHKHVAFSKMLQDSVTDSH